jgi:hypothetical protein
MKKSRCSKNKKTKKRGRGGNILKKKEKKREQHRVLSTSACGVQYRKRHTGYVGDQLFIGG